MHRLFRANLAALLVATAVPIAAQAPNRSTASTPRAASRPQALAAAARDTNGVLPGTRAGSFTTIQGTALNWTNAALANASLRLRDARLGHVVDTTTTDKAGLFTFHSVDPGSYIVEVMDREKITAASQIIYVTAGESASAVVKLPFRPLAWGGVFGASPGTAATSAVTNIVNAAEGVATLVSTGQPVSPQR
jgi:carboxypeptidase family protein